ncbi:MAG: Mu-like prophage major head subunit gpT family protein [Pseudomonadota bacterium]
MEVTGANIAALGVSLKTEFNQGMSTVAPMWDRVATKISSTNAANQYNWLNKWPRLREWIGDRRVKQLSGHSYTLPNKKYEATIEVEITDIEDDELGMYSTMANAQGVAAAKWPDETVFSILPKGFTEPGYDGQNFFDDDHPVINAETGAVESYSNKQNGAGAAWYLLDTSQSLKPFIWQERVAPQFNNKTNADDSDTVFMKDQALFGTRARGNAGFAFHEMAAASKAELNRANFEALYTAMTSQVDDEGSPLAVMPTLLVVPPSLRAAANELIKAERRANGETNTDRDLVEVLVCPYLK